MKAEIPVVKSVRRQRDRFKQYLKDEMANLRDQLNVKSRVKGDIFRLVSRSPMA